MAFPQSIQDAFQKRDLLALQKAVMMLPVKKMADGGQVLEDFLQAVDCVRYVTGGIEFQAGGRTVVAPTADEVLLLPTAVSLCGTDIDLIDKAKNGTLPAEAMGKVVGHEAAGMVIGVGKNVKNWKIGQMVCLDSHFGCGQSGHENFDDCIHSGKSCDGIVGGIRGAMQTDGKRSQPRDGYWSRVISVPASALPVELPVKVAQYLASPSTLESLGNIYMIIGQLEQADLIRDAAKTVLVVSGIGATGYPMAAIATHYGFQTIGINPSAGKRQFAEAAGVCQATFAKTAEVLPYLQPKMAAGEITRVIFTVMVGEEEALTSALAMLRSPELGGLERRVCVAFGLYHDATKEMPELPAGTPSIAQRDFVFSRKSFTTRDKMELYGVCGRDLKAWQTLMKDLKLDKNGQPPALIEMLNKPIYTLEVADPLAEITRILNKGSREVKTVLDQHQALKLAANFMKATI